MHACAQLAQFLHAHDCVLQLVHLDALKPVYMQSFGSVRAVEKHKSGAIDFGTGWVQAEPRETVLGAKAHESVVADWLIELRSLYPWSVILICSSAQNFSQSETSTRAIQER